MARVLGIVYRVIATHLIKKAGQTHKMAHTGAVTLIQRFGSALNLNIHLHMLFLDGVYVDNWKGTWFGWVKASTSAELTRLLSRHTQPSFSTVVMADGSKSVIYTSIRVLLAIFIFKS
jgi:hypothetical protein